MSQGRLATFIAILECSIFNFMDWTLFSSLIFTSSTFKVYIIFHVLCFKFNSIGYRCIEAELVRIFIIGIKYKYSLTNYYSFSTELFK